MVEDNKLSMKMMQTLLAKEGIKFIDCAEDGSKAVDMILANNYGDFQLERLTSDLVFMDFQMPIMDGCQATEIIRKEESQQGRRSTTLIAVTANVMDCDVKRALTAGMNDFLGKPVRLANLREIVSKYLDN